MHGHFWTIAPLLRDRLREPYCSERPWRTRSTTAEGVPLTLRGWLHEVPGSQTLLVLVHGLGGSAHSGYMLRAARAAGQRRISTLRINLRGADRASADFYHAGLVEDLAALAKDPVVLGYPRVTWLGFSLGGHVLLRALALGAVRADAAASMCAPLDLEAGCRFIDRPSAWPYRQYLLRGLRDMFRAVHRRRPQHMTPAQTESIRTIREWDERVVAPRFGFAGASDYYAKMSVAPIVGQIRVPTRVVVAARDPMVSLAGIEPYLRALGPSISPRVLERGGHVGFAPKDDPTAEILDFLSEGRGAI